MFVVPCEERLVLVLPQELVLYMQLPTSHPVKDINPTYA